jgi:hypothetical protein
VDVAKLSLQNIKNQSRGKQRKKTPFVRYRTAVILTNGFNGLGLHTLFGVIHMFGKEFRNFIFVQVGVVDSGTFKSTEEIEYLRRNVDDELQKYSNFMRSQGYYAEGISAVAVDVVEEVCRLAPDILKRYPRALFFGGQLVFPREPMFSRWLHNYTVFSIQRRFYFQGIPLILLPIRM